MASLLLLIAVISLAPAASIVAAPQRWARAVTGWALLIVGVLMIDSHIATPHPYDDDGVDIGFGAMVQVIWVLTLPMALLLRSRALLEFQNNVRSPLWRAIGCWSVPAAILFAVIFHHWLANRLAGAAPAGLVHLLVVLAAVVVLCGAIVIAWRSRQANGLHRLGILFPCALMIIVLLDAQKGFAMWDRAVAMAADHPFCLMTYGGFEHRRRARDGWDLSPLVDRHHGTWAVSKTPFLVVATDQGVQMYRWFPRRWQDVPDDKPQCVPE